MAELRPLVPFEKWKLNDRVSAKGVIGQTVCGFGQVTAIGHYAKSLIMESSRFEWVPTAAGERKVAMFRFT
jgi:hypothetical protein